MPPAAIAASHLTAPEANCSPRPLHDVAVLLHGLGSGGLMMWPLARRLERAGYQTINWKYPSFRHTIADHARKLHPLLASLDADPTVRRIHLVAYSMGSIIARYALTLGAPAKLGRIVMIAPPNRGSRWATWLGPRLRWCVGIVDELAARSDSFVNMLPLPERLEFGVIAASCDLLVGCANTHLAGQKDHIVLAGLHSTIPLQRRAARAVLNFLVHGQFSPTNAAGLEPAAQA